VNAVPDSPATLAAAGVAGEFERRPTKGVALMSRISQIQIPPAADEQGQTLVEYSVILAFVAVLCLGALQLVGSSISTMLTSVANQI
jgi:Flp pilus assembly pilin Flp